MASVDVVNVRKAYGGRLAPLLAKTTTGTEAHPNENEQPEKSSPLLRQSEPVTGDTCARPRATTARLASNKP